MRIAREWDKKMLDTILYTKSTRVLENLWKYDFDNKKINVVEVLHME